MANVAIDDLPTAVTIDGSTDILPIYTANVDATQGINRDTLLGLVSGPVGLTDTQAVTNKTLGNTNTVTLKDMLFTLQDDGDITKQAKFQLSGITTATTRTFTLPDVTDTLVSLTATQTLTNKTLTSPTINSPTITNATISTDAITGYTSANNGSFYGISVSASKFSATALTDGTLTPAKLTTGTGSTWAYTSYTPTFTNITVGNGTLVTKYIQIGKTVHVRFSFILGSTSSVSSSPTFTLPVTSASDYTSGQHLGITALNDAGVQGYGGVISWSSTTTAALLYYRQDSAPIKTAGISSTTPFTWGNGDIIAGSFVYEAA